MKTFEPSFLFGNVSRDCSKLCNSDFLKFALNTGFHHFQGAVVHPFTSTRHPFHPFSTRSDMPKKCRKAQAALTREAALHGHPAQPQVPDSSSKYEPGPSDEEGYTPSVSNDAEMHVGSPNHKADTSAGDWSAESDSDMSVDNRDNSEDKCFFTTAAPFLQSFSFPRGDQRQLHNRKDTCSKVSRSLFSCHHSQFLSKNVAVHGCIPVSELALKAFGLIFCEQYWAHRCSRFQGCEAIQVSSTSWTHQFHVDFSTPFLKIL